VNARPFSGQSVLVIGMGNTGAEIALDLCEGGARPVLSLRGGVHVVPRDLFGIPIQVVAMIGTKLLPTRVNDVLFPPLLDLALGYPAKHGLKRPKEGILQQIARIGRIPVLDVGTTRKISEGSIAIAPGISAMTGNGAIFDDGNERAFDTIILATGFRPSYSRFLDAGSDDRAIYFVGFTNPVTGLLREIARDAVRTVDDIVRQSAGRAPCLSPKANGQSTGP
jgi:cation diffusion facilitator CzcD-associated flavoprotein CzcO